LFSSPRQAAQPDRCRGNFGLVTTDIPFEIENKLHLGNDEGAIIKEILEGSTASRLGLKVGDVILEADNQSIGGYNCRLRTIFECSTPGRELLLTIVREDQRLVVTLIRPEGGLSDGGPQERTGGGIACDSLLGLMANPVYLVRPEVATQLYLGQDGVFVGAVFGSHMDHYLDYDTPASTAGLRVGDVILEVNDEKIRGPVPTGASPWAAANSLYRLIANSDPNREIRLTVIRNGQKMLVTFARPPDLK
jgi:serine protease Do